MTEKQENGIVIEGTAKIDGEAEPIAQGGKLDLVVLAQNIVEALFADLEHRNGHQAAIQATAPNILAAHKDMWVTITTEIILRAIVGGVMGQEQENQG